jgi:hypothetical protein
MSAAIKPNHPSESSITPPFQVPLIASPTTHLQKLARETHQSAAAGASPLTLHVHLQRHLGRLLHGGLLAAAFRDAARDGLLIKQLGRLRHGQAYELALGTASPSRAAAEHLEGLHGGRRAHARVGGGFIVAIVVIVVEVFLVVADGGCVKEKSMLVIVFTFSTNYLCLSHTIFHLGTDT